ncbi:hypothetical protein TorRG33x02_023360 [Trema orientale]|uniref:Uncharacterized protein n=1 Tax=Trema orientale TaxID=63057 RepID=A0A2P5FUT9_TREOI|nr:hypothetical protein TorRG33x02_023360 [Trema orientale]
MAAYGVHGLSVYNFIFLSNKKATYASIMHPISSPSNLTFLDEVVNLVVKPPVVTKMPGRPKNTRIESTGEDTKSKNVYVVAIQATTGKRTIIQFPSVTPLMKLQTALQEDDKCRSVNTFT